MNKDTLVRSFLKAERIKMKKARNVIIGIFLVMFAFCYGFSYLPFFRNGQPVKISSRFSINHSLPYLFFLFI
jgi:flagellar basal body-associated protein FliL